MHSAQGSWRPTRHRTCWTGVAIRLRPLSKIATRGFADWLPALAAHYAAAARWDTPFSQRRRSHVFHASSIEGGRSEVVSGRGARHL